MTGAGIIDGTDTCEQFIIFHFFQLHDFQYYGLLLPNNYVIHLLFLMEEEKRNIIGFFILV